jgi:chemotaxis protein methyltransferase CheR
MTNGSAVRPKISGAPQWIDDASFERIANMVQKEAGIVISESKRSLMVSRLARRLRALGLADFESYCAVIERQDAGSERREMLFLLTTNVTRFFREAHHFESLRDHTLPKLLLRAKNGDRVRIWSAGCSSGEEPYSIAMTVLDAMPDAGRFDLRILATDIDANMIATAQGGVYRGIDRGHVSQETLNKHFEPVSGESDTWRVGTPVRDLVQFAELNLLHPWPMKGRFDVIFCRNVVIYFDGDTQAKLWSRFGDALQPDGRLFIGHSERVVGPATSTLTGAGVTQYTRNNEELRVTTQGAA